MLLQNYMANHDISKRLSEEDIPTFKKLKSWVYPYMYNYDDIKRLNDSLIELCPLHDEIQEFPTHTVKSLDLSTPQFEDFQKIQQKIDLDDSNNNYVFHIQTKETLMENIKVDARQHARQSVDDKKTRLYDHETSSFINNDCYSYLDSGTSSFFKVDTYYHHWQLKDNVLVDSGDSQHISFINNTKIMSLDTLSNEVIELCNFKHKIVNFDISEDFIVACGYRVMSSYPNEYHGLFFHDFDVSSEDHHNQIRLTSPSGRENLYVPTDRDQKHYVACYGDETNVHSLDKGIVFVHDRHTGMTYEFSMGLYMNNTARIVDFPTNSEHYLLNADLKVLVTNNDGCLYYLAFSHSYFEIVKVKLAIPNNTVSNESLNNIAVNDTMTDVVITSDSNVFMSFKISALCSSLQTIDLGREPYIKLATEIHFAPSGSFAMSAVFLKDSSRVVVSYQNGRVHVLNLTDRSSVNLVLPFRTFEESIRNVVVDSKNNIYICQNSGTVHVYLAEQLSADTTNHIQLNFPNTSYLHNLASMDEENTIIKQKITPYVSTSSDIYNAHAWISDRNRVVHHEKTASNAHTLSSIFLDSIQQESSSTSLESKLRNEMYGQLFELERLVMLEKKNLYAGLLMESEVKVNKYFNFIAGFFPRTFWRIMSMHGNDLTRVLPFDKIMTRSYIPYKYNLDQYAMLSVLKRDSFLFERYKQQDCKIVFQTPKVPEDYVVSNKSKMECDKFDLLIRNSLNKTKHELSDDENAEYETYTKCILNAFRNGSLDKNHKLDDHPNNKITGMAIRIVNNEEQLVVGTSSGIYTIPIMM
ncbi:unnamed protein product [Hanseniaspora opuntiae]